MQDEEHTKAELLQELDVLRRRVCKFEQSEKQLKELFDNAVVGIYRTTPDGRFILANTAFVRMLGFSSFEELSGKKVGDEEFTPGYPRSTFKDLIEKKGKVIGFESSFMRRDGTTIFVRENARVVRDSSGRALYYEGVVEDITEIKKREEELKESEQKFRSIFDNAVDGIVLADVESKRFSIGNKAFLEMLGYSAEEIENLGVMDIHPKESLPYVTEQFQKQSRREISLARDLPVKRKDGSVFYADVNAFPMTLDGKSHLAGIFRDVTERKKAEDALQKSEESGRAILDATTESVLLIDKQGTILTINKTGARRFGRSVEELVGTNVWDVALGLIPPDLIKSRREQIDKVLHSGKPLRFEDRRKEKIYDNNIYPIFDEKGQVTRLAIFARDITEQRKAEEMLRELKYRYQNLFETTPMGVGVATREGKVLECNKAMLQMTGYSLEEFKQINLADTYQEPRSRQMLLRRLQKDGFVRDFEVQLKRKDGATYYASLTIAPITLDGRDVLLTVQEDITERKKAEDAQKQLVAIIEATPDFVGFADAKDKHIIYVNKAGRKMCGIANDEDVTKLKIYDVHPEWTNKMFAEEILPAAVRDGTWEGECAFLNIRDRHEIPVLMVLSSHKASNGEVEVFSTISRDITEQKRAQEMLNNYREKMAQAERLASLGALSATFAHELTQPLTVINLSIENVLAELKVTSRNRSVIEQLEDGLSGVVNATSIIDRFRNFARKSSEKTFGKVDLKAVAEKITKLLNERARRAKVSLRMKGLGSLPPIYSKERELEQLFFALLDNAIQAADGKKDRKVLVSGTMRDEHIELRFSDDCGGIAPEHIDKLFEPFFTTKPPGEGTGLGLCIVQRIVAQAGGRIRVKNKPGTGLTFFVTLPSGKSRRPW